VELGKGTVLAVRRENLEPVSPEDAAADAAMEAAAAAAASQIAESKKHRTVHKNNAILEEFDGTRDPDSLALYYHFKDGAFDCFNAPEYNTQMLRYYSVGMAVVSCVPRRIRSNEYFLVCLQYKEPEQNTFCEVAFNCQRSFAGISMLVKRQCFACHRPGAPLCACQCACFCSRECEASEVGVSHRQLCQLARGSNVAVEDECVQLF